MDDDSSKIEATPRTLVLCLDGTVGKFDSDITNVVKLFSVLRRDDTTRQQCYYQPGIGTYFQPGVVSRLFTLGAQLLDNAIAWYLDEHVMDAYRFLMRTYRKGDKICLFGFSRGAYTARALAGMLTKVGLLLPENFQSVSFAYKLYARTDDEGIRLAAGFKKTFCQDVKVEFVGVWDTVQSTGILHSRALPFTNSNTGIRTFRHAVSLDEHRANFQPNLYHRSSGERFSISKQVLPDMHGRFSYQRGSPDGRSLEHVAPQQVHPQPDGFETDVLEVWFSGTHGDVGGGNVANDAPTSLAQIPLRWMVEQIIASDCGILFDDQELSKTGITLPSKAVADEILLNAKDPKTVGGLQKRNVSGSAESTTKETSQDPELQDAISPLFDDLQVWKVWWLLEIIPQPWTWQGGDGTWHTHWGIHLGKGRLIPYKEPLFHHTVKVRENKLEYKPRAIHDGDPIYV